MDPLGSLATLTAPELQSVQAQVGRVASTVPNVTDKYDARCNGLVCDIATQGFTCDQAVVNARKARWCTARPAARLRGARPDVARARQLTHTAPRAQGKAAARCGAVQGTTMFNVTRASAGLDVISGTFAGEPYTPVDPGVAAAQAQLQTAYSAGISDAGAVRGLRSAYASVSTLTRPYHIPYEHNCPGALSGRAAPGAARRRPGRAEHAGDRAPRADRVRRAARAAGRRRAVRECAPRRGSTRAAGSACQARRAADGGCRARRQELHVLRVRGAHQRDRPVPRVEAHERRCAPCSAGACKLFLLRAGRRCTLLRARRVLRGRRQRRRAAVIRVSLLRKRQQQSAPGRIDRKRIRSVERRRRTARECPQKRRATSAMRQGLLLTSAGQMLPVLQHQPAACLC